MITEEIINANKSESFDKFNRRARRPDRKRHMELCGFTRACSDVILPEGVKPMYKGYLIAAAFNEKKGKAAHVVYWKGGRNMDGERGYQFWIKEL
jgi:hypothetical protein